MQLLPHKQGSWKNVYKTCYGCSRLIVVTVHLYGGKAEALLLKQSGLILYIFFLFSLVGSERNGLDFNRQVTPTI